MNNEISLNYYGGSGGFLALWIILLGTKYRCVWKGPDQSLDEVKHKHWNINNVKEWKSTEVWPDFNGTLDSSLEHKVFFHCSPTTTQWEKQTGLRVIVYTDWNTQMLLSEYKNAFVFNRNETINWMSNHVNRSFYTSYYNVKDESWPDLWTIDDYDLLPKRIQLELQQTLNFTSKKDYIDQIFNQTKIHYKGDEVWHELDDKILDASVVVKLQDIVKTNGNSLLEPLGYKTNDNVTELLAWWLSKHPNRLREILK